MDVHPCLQPTIGSFESPGGTGGKEPRFLLANLRCLSLQVALKELARILDGAGDERHTLEVLFPKSPTQIQTSLLQQRYLVQM